MTSYDSTQDTNKHINTVRVFLAAAIYNFEQRRLEHDASKLLPPEKQVFDEFTPQLRELTYGSDEYKQALTSMGEGLTHHYAVNSHHPEHYENGINGMSLFDLLEMLADWKAAAQRHADGNLKDSLEINIKRFGMSDQLAEIFRNTIGEMKW